jgi:transcriptional regulator with XRE-family HTH domain
MRFSPDALYESCVERELTGHELADASGVSVERISLFFRGADSPNVAEAALLAGALGLVVSDLFEMDEAVVLPFRRRRRPSVRPFTRKLADVIPIRKARP